ncbi:hypothetical protein RSAG8_04032, partial [Rhizoctonia solani AG-8 WAC10335]
MSGGSQLSFTAKNIGSHVKTRKHTTNARLARRQRERQRQQSHSRLQGVVESASVSQDPELDGCSPEDRGTNDTSLMFEPIDDILEADSESSDTEFDSTFISPFEDRAGVQPSYTRIAQASNPFAATMSISAPTMHNSSTHDLRPPIRANTPGSSASHNSTSDLEHASRLGSPYIAPQDPSMSNAESDSSSDSDLDAELDALFSSAKNRYRSAHTQKHQRAQTIKELPPPTAEFYPYTHLAFYLMDIIFNSPRMRFSRIQKAVILEFARLLGAPYVPSLHAYKEFERLMKKEMGDPTRKFTSSFGNIFYFNDIGESLAKDMSNPLSRQNMTFYPHHCGNYMAQTWHGKKMLESVSDDMLSPTLRYEEKTYWVNEVVQRTSGTYFIPKRWVLRGKDNSTPWCFGYEVKETEQGLVVSTKKRICVAVSTFARTYEEVVSNRKFPGFAVGQEEITSQMPHPLRTTAAGRQVYSIPLIIFMDDVSGARSTQWNKHYSVYMSNGAIPREELQREFHVRYVTTSSHAEPLELMQGIRESFERNFAEPIVAFDAKTQEEVLLRPWPLFWPGDNPMQAEHCSSAGLNASHFCRTCEVGGSQEYCSSDKGFAELILPGIIRDPEKTQAAIKSQLSLSLEPRSGNKLRLAAVESGVKDSLAQVVIEKLIKLGKSLRSDPNQTHNNIQNTLKNELEVAQRAGCENPLLQMQGVNIHLDTPTEILHTILLGVVKYFWSQTVYVLEKNKKFEIMRSRLHSIDQRGLNIPAIPATYICDYKGALIGKHFKALVQVLAFVIYDLVDNQNLVDAWILTSRLTVLLWQTEIHNVENYLVELKQVIADLLHVTAICSPSILLSKPKFHFLVHLPLYIERFGPAILFSTERFESFNGVFRGASIFSNRQSPSRDIALSFAGLDRVKHLATGGYWRHNHSNSWRTASPKLQELIHSHRVFAELLGLDFSEEPVPGDIYFYPQERSITGSRMQVNKQETWDHVMARLTIQIPSPDPSRAINGMLYMSVKGIVMQSGDIVEPGHSIIYNASENLNGPNNPEHRFARVVELLCCTNTADPSDVTYFAILQKFSLGSTRHHILGMPQLVLDKEFCLCEPQKLICCVNVQHDCSQGQCTLSSKIPIRQERELTERWRFATSHSDDSRYILNVQALHNSKYIEESLPTDLRGALVRLEDRSEILKQGANNVRNKKAQKDANRQATKAAKDAFTRSLEASGARELELQEAEIYDETQGAGTSNQGATAGLALSTEQQSRNFSLLTVEILKSLCRKHKLAVSGAKGQLIERLISLYQSNGLSLPTHDEIEQLKSTTPISRINNLTTGASVTPDHDRPDGSEPPPKRRRPPPLARPTNLEGEQTADNTGTNFHET